MQHLIVSTYLSATGSLGPTGEAPASSPRRSTVQVDSNSLDITDIDGSMALAAYLTGVVLANIYDMKASIDEAIAQDKSSWSWSVSFRCIIEGCVFKSNFSILIHFIFSIGNPIFSSRINANVPWVLNFKHSSKPIPFTLLFLFFPLCCSYWIDPFSHYY